MILATDVCKLPSKNGYSSYKWPTVEEAWRHLFPSNTYNELHRGADDARHEALIVFELYQQGIFNIK